jgi:hypothetical protein
MLKEPGVPTLQMARYMNISVGSMYSARSSPAITTSIVLSLPCLLIVVTQRMMGRDVELIAWGTGLLYV